jgi:hypothetical protein
MKKGISLIVLVITIVISLILLSVVIVNLSNDNMTDKSSEVVFKSNLKTYQDQLELYISNKNVEYKLRGEQYDPNNDVDFKIETVIPSIKAEDKNDYYVYNGKLVYSGENREWVGKVSSDYFEVELVNKPELVTGMTAVKWNNVTNTWDTVSDPNIGRDWYDYSNKKWANAKTLDGSMWVWIPRYEYKIPTSHVNTSQTIEINFLNNLINVPTDGYTIHPAFTFGTTDIKGIWMAKFEASGNISAIDIKPGITSLRNITIDSMFTACRNMETNDRYGWGTNGNGIDTHLTKNIEWGAVSYLSQSIYGKNSEVWINPNSNYLTGQAGTSVNSNMTTSTYPYNNTTYGINASTTGNIYGVYDMNGGSWEHTAAYINNGNSNLTTYGLSLVNADDKYKDIYLKGTNDTRSLNYNANSNKKGDAVYETSISGDNSTSWYGDFSYMPISIHPFFERGGVYY